MHVGTAFFAMERKLLIVVLSLLLNKRSAGFPLSNMLNGFMHRLC